MQNSPNRFKYNCLIKIFILIFILNWSKSYSQENYNSLSSNYMPTNSVLINPSSMLDAKTRVDINLVSAAGFFMNNILFLEKTSVRSYLYQKQFENELDFTVNLENRKYHLYSRLAVQGPGFVFSQGDHAFGLGLGLKSYTSIRNIPNAIIIGAATRKVPEDKKLAVKNIAMTTMNYGDIKLSYAYTFLKKKRELFMGGVSLSKFIPIQSASTKVEKINAELVQDTLGLVNEMNSDLINQEIKQVLFSSGFGLDFGFTYERMLAESYNYLPNSNKNNCRKNFYLYKIGVSIMDIGKLKFQEDETQYIGVKSNAYTFSREDFSGTNFQILNNLRGEAITTSDKSQAFVKKINNVRLPTYISLQGDYNAWNNKIYVNLTWVQRLPLAVKKLGTTRSNSIALTPRYETKYFEVAMPFSLYEYSKPQLGFMFRAWFFTLGTDKLGSYLFDSDVYGSDIYVAFKIPIVYHPACRDGFRDKFNYYPKRYRWRTKSCNGM
jgi:hypothetical protein